MQNIYKNEIQFLLKFGNPNIKSLSFQIKKFKGLNWNYIIKQADYHQISPYIYVNFKKSNSSIPTEMKNKFKLRYVNSLSKYINLEQEFKKITLIFLKENIEFVPLKGFALIGTIYKEPVVRPVADIDILVKPENLSKINKVLKEHGYKKTFARLSEKYYKEHHCHYMYIKNGILIEIHWALSFNKPNKIIIPKLWQRIIDFKIHNLNLKNLSIEDTLIALVLHQRRFDKPLYLKTLLDINILIEKYQNLVDWNYICKIAIKNRLKHLFYLIFYTIKFLYNTSIPEEILNKFRPVYFKKKIIKKIVQKYIFHPENHTHKFRKSFYLKLNFIWYDTLWGTLVYLSWLSQEKFAKYYNFKPYSYKTKYLYKIRFIYIPIKSTINLLKNSH